MDAACACVAVLALTIERAAKALHAAVADRMVPIARDTVALLDCVPVIDLPAERVSKTLDA